MLDPISLAAAALLVSKAIEGFAGEAGKRSWDELQHLASRIRRRLRADDATATVLAEAEARPDDQASLERLAMVLKLYAAQDQDLRQDIHDLVAGAKHNPVAARFITNLYDESKVGMVVNANQLNVSGDFDPKGFANESG
jgi:hypothetical protein